MMSRNDAMFQYEQSDLQLILNAKINVTCIGWMSQIHLQHSTIPAIHQKNLNLTYSKKV